MKVILMCFIFGTEFLKCLKYCKGGGGEVEEKTESSTSRTRSIRIFQIILFKMESATLKNHFKNGVKNHILHDSLLLFQPQIIVQLKSSELEDIKSFLTWVKLQYIRYQMEFIRYSRNSWVIFYLSKWLQ